MERRERAHDSRAQRVGKVERAQFFSAGSHSVLNTIAGALSGGLFGYLGRHFG